MVFLIGGIILLVGLMLVFFSSSFIDIGYGYQASLNAEAAAVSGAQDAMLQLERNTATSSYSLPVASTTVAVTVTQNAPSTNYITVLSVATVSLRTRKVQAILFKDPTTGQFTVTSWQEIQ